MTTSDRPTARPRPPRAAPDEHIDPVAGGAAAQSVADGAGASHRYGAPRITEAGRKGSPEATVQLNSRVSTDAAEVVEAAMRETGWTKRTVIEHAIRSTYNPKSS